MKLRSALLASAMMALPIAAANAQVAGPYISLGAGVNIMQDENIRSVNTRNFSGISLNSVDLGTHLGAVGVLAGGWGFGNGLRAELEFDYRYNGLNNITGPNFSRSVGGSEQKYGPMVNVLYDFNGLTPWVTPYIGVGIGYQWVPIHLAALGLSGSATEGNFATQAILGGAMPIPSVPGLSLTGEYRFHAIVGDRTYSGARVGDDLNHSVLIGLRYEFGMPPRYH
jgi:opacity protein-like surface antigen